MSECVSVVESDICYAMRSEEQEEDETVIGTEVDIHQETGVKQMKAVDRSDRVDKSLKSPPVDVIFVSSRDEPGGIADDLFLIQALVKRGLHCRYMLWTEVTEDVVLVKNRPLVLIRSLWDGRTRQGSTPNLLEFFSRMANCWPQLKYDYDLLDWTAHKRYLIELKEADITIVPTCLVPASCEEVRGLTYPEDCGVECTPGGVKREMIERGWNDAIIKPASSGGRCEGVTRLSLSEWSAGMAFGVAALLKEGDCVLQPFLPAVLVTLTEVPLVGGKRKSIDPNHAGVLLGEVCVVCIDGIISHAIHKNPRQWGWHESSCSCAGSTLDLATSVCTCRVSTELSSIHRPVVSNITFHEPQGNRLLHFESDDAAILLRKSPVERVKLPLPTDLVNCVHRVMDVIRAKR